LSTDIEFEKRANELVDKWIQGFRRGSLRFFILHLLLHKNHHKSITSADKDSFHGYHIAKVIDKVTEGRWHPTTASIYPILKHFEEEGVIEIVPDHIDYEGKRFTKNYRLTPHGVKIAEKVEQARKDFRKPFILAKEKSAHIPALKLKGKLSDKEILELLKEVNLSVLEKERKNLAESIQSLQQTLEILDKEIINRKEIK
jgi:DNA-binding PadR family transcriptional regulator